MAILFYASRNWIDLFFIFYFFYLETLKSFVKALPSSYLIIYLHNKSSFSFSCLGLTDNLIFLEKKKKEYIYHYYNQLDLVFFYLYSHQFVSAYIFLISFLHFHSYQFVGIYIFLVFFPYFSYHEIASALLIVFD